MLSENRVDLTLNAVVVQTTGEDWSDAELTLSTARPSAGVAPPDLPPFWLEEYAPYVEYWEDEYDDFAGDADEEELEEMPMEEAKREARPPPPPPAPMQVVKAEVAERAVATTFTVPGDSSVPGDGTRRKLRASPSSPWTWSSCTSPCRGSTSRRGWSPRAPGRRAGPCWVEASPRSSTTRSWARRPSTQSARSGEVELPFGRDDAVQIEKEIVEDNTSRPDWLGKITLRQSWRYTAKNGRDQAIHLELRDRVPVSKETRYVVRYTGRGARRDHARGPLHLHPRSGARRGRPRSSSATPCGYPRRHPPGVLP